MASSDHKICTKEGPLYRYNGGGILSFKKSWKPCYGVLTDDSVLKLYKDQTLTTKSGEYNIQSSVLWMAFGKDAEKYDPPEVAASKDPQDPVNLALQQKCYIAVPKDKSRDSITWLATDNMENLHTWIRAIALTVKSKYRPPILGAKRSDYKKILEELRSHFHIDENTEEWEAYWLYSALGNRPNLHTTTLDEDGDFVDIHSHDGQKVVKTDILKKIESNLVENEDDRLIEKIFPMKISREHDGNLFVIEKVNGHVIETCQPDNDDNVFMEVAKEDHTIQQPEIENHQYKKEVKGHVIEPSVLSHQPMLITHNEEDHRKSYKTTLEICINQHKQ